MFNQGLPEQFSFVTTFRNRNRGRGRRWHLIRITDSRGQPQFAVGLDPNRKTVEFSIKKYDGSLQTLSWERPQVFSDECGEWQKIHFGVFRDRVLLYTNCQRVGDKPLEYVDARIDLNGEILVAKEAGSARTMPIDLQWMVMTCDPESVERETCEELPNGGLCEAPATECPTNCPAGQPGKRGERGQPGRPGPLGERGRVGRPGPPGEAGKQGFPGIPGEMGRPGPQGSPGLRGPQGPEGIKGGRGVPGSPGPFGPPGKQGGLGKIGMPGERGQPGLTGPQGKPGERGLPGDVRSVNGPPGLPGPKGNAGQSVSCTNLPFVKFTSRALLRYTYTKEY